MTLDETERHLREGIAVLEADHRRRMEPLYRRLADIMALRTPVIILPLTDLSVGDRAALNRFTNP